ncbi:hypothetical protein FHS23_004630 [Prauserella isguenensis]|uniref:Uncharacterized protein n=1 Tax=Prauserella isguenensis TaxID=1470180 RepID=A0A839S707_9PSEU|nr:hypothetical protein [Prauserella isguenensis]
MNTIDPLAVDLPGLEPTDADLVALENEAWDDTQSLIEALLAEQAEATDLRDRRARLAPVLALPTARGVEPHDLDQMGVAA